MKVTRTATLKEVQDQEAAVHANIRLGSYNMPAADTFTLYAGTLDGADLERLFLTAEFGKLTTDGSCRLNRLKDDARVNVAKRVQGELDLRNVVDRAIVALSVARDEMPLTVIDGHHRLMHQFLTFGTVQDVPLFLCVHAELGRLWRGFIPRDAVR
jgi:hypothetical protein